MGWLFKSKEDRLKEELKKRLAPVLEDFREREWTDTEDFSSAVSNGVAKIIEAMTITHPEAAKIIYRWHERMWAHHTEGDYDDEEDD